jgi:hypothetical protein|tara:strand:+ start:1474 stop:1677 length:204 start_codon:yes stop_codon:yes gene_type:complete
MLSAFKTTVTVANCCYRNIHAHLITNLVQKTPSKKFFCIKRGFGVINTSKRGGIVHKTGYSLEEKDA